MLNERAPRMARAQRRASPRSTGRILSGVPQGLQLISRNSLGFHRLAVGAYPLISIILSRVFLLATCGLEPVLASHDSTCFNVTECFVEDSRIKCRRILGDQQPVEINLNASLPLTWHT